MIEVLGMYVSHFIYILDFIFDPKRDIYNEFNSFELLE